MVNIWGKKERNIKTKERTKKKWRGNGAADKRRKKRKTAKKKRKIEMTWGLTSL